MWSRDVIEMFFIWQWFFVHDFVRLRLVRCLNSSSRKHEKFTKKRNDLETTTEISKISELHQTDIMKSDVLLNYEFLLFGGNITVSESSKNFCKRLYTLSFP